MTLSDIQAFGVICGPGSFTGVRIGLTTVKGLAETQQRPTVAVTAFEAWVERFPEWRGVMVPMIDARRGEVYAAVFERGRTGLVQRDSGFVGAPRELLDALDEETVLFLGGGAQKYRDLIRSRAAPGGGWPRPTPFWGAPWPHWRPPRRTAGNGPRRRTCAPSTCAGPMRKSIGKGRERPLGCAVVHLNTV